MSSIPSDLGSSEKLGPGGHLSDSMSTPSSRRGSLTVQDFTDTPDASPSMRRKSSFIEKATGLFSTPRSRNNSASNRAEAECLAHIAQSVVLHEGWLTKCGGSVKSWKKRWFVLVPSHLTYSKEEKSDKEPLGAIPLATYDCNDAPEIGKPHGFKMCSAESSQRVYFIHTYTAEEKRVWMEEISKAIKALRERTDTLGLPEAMVIECADMTTETPDFAPPPPLSDTPTTDLPLPPPDLFAFDPAAECEQRLPTPMFNVPPPPPTSPLPHCLSPRPSV